LISPVTFPAPPAAEPGGDPLLGDPLLRLRISARYPGGEPVLENAELSMAAGEILGLVGRSGEGKSTIGMAILKLLSFRGAVATGEIRFRGRDLLALPEREMRRVRGREIALVPQSPIAALNPALTIGAQFREAWSAHSAAPIETFTPRLDELLASVSLPAGPQFLRRYPRELSVGIAQRVLIAMALVHAPSLILADEPTSALDMITQSEILELLGRVNRQRNTAILYISHDLLSVATLCHRVAILHQGRIVECGSTSQIFRAPQHEYTRRLIDAIPENPY
jgi:ABC-type glutathione transport system ATPase component